MTAFVAAYRATAVGSGRPAEDARRKGQEGDRPQERQVEDEQPIVEAGHGAEQPVVGRPPHPDDREAQEEAEQPRGQVDDRRAQLGVGRDRRQLGQAEVDDEQGDRDRHHGVREEHQAIEVARLALGRVDRSRVGHRSG